MPLTGFGQVDQCAYFAYVRRLTTTSAKQGSEFGGSSWLESPDGSPELCQVPQTSLASKGKDRNSPLSHFPFHAAGIWEVDTHEGQWQ